MIARLDGPPKVTGQARYGADHHYPGTVHGYIVLSTIAHGEITALCDTAARDAPGVLAVYSPFTPLGIRRPAATVFGQSRVPLLDREVVNRGQPIGFVVAETFEQARAAAALVEVTYRTRPALTSLAAGLATAEDAVPSGNEVPSSLSVLPNGVGSMTRALADSPVTVDAVYRTAPQNHAALEPHSAVAVWDGDHLVVHTGNQGAHLQAAELADALGITADRVRVVSPFVGGAFGGKGSTCAPAFLAAAASRALGRPIKAELTREQVFTSTAGRAATVQRISIGADRTGRLLALRHDSWCGTAADRSFVERTSHSTSRTWYATENLAISQKVVPLHTPPTTYMRAPGEAPGSFALESAIDELAIALDVDPIELRLRNDSTGPSATGPRWSSKHLDQCFRTGARRFGWGQRPPRGHVDGDWLVGTGTAAAVFPALLFPATVAVTVHDDGTAEVATSGADPGTGLLTVLALVAADCLEIAPDRVTPRLGDSVLPSGGISGASTGTASVATAIADAVAQVKNELLAAAAEPGGPFENRSVTYSAGAVHAHDRTMPLGELLRTVGRASISAVGSTTYATPDTHAFGTFGAQFCEVRVHCSTREVRVSRMLGVFDCGRIINPKAARGQITGGMIWGVSAALHEGLELEPSGRFANGDLAGYLIPVNADIPDVEVHFVDHPDMRHNPFGAKGVGEIGVVGMAAAVANAVHHATGIRVRHLPIRVEDLLD